MWNKAWKEVQGVQLIFYKEYVEDVHRGRDDATLVEVT